MSPSQNLGYFAVVFRGGDVIFIPAYEAVGVMQAKAQNAVTALERPDGAMVIDPASVERVLRAEEWIQSVETKIQGDGRRVCLYGTVHVREETCRCMKAGRLPLTEGAARAALEVGKKYAELPPEKRAEYDDNDPSLRDLCKNQYFKRVAAAHGLRLLTQDNGKA